MRTDVYSRYLDAVGHCSHPRPEDDSDTRFGVRCAGPVNGIRQADGFQWSYWIVLTASSHTDPVVIVRTLVKRRRRAAATSMMLANVTFQLPATSYW